MCWNPHVGRLRYANNSNYKKDQMIRKEVSGKIGVSSEMWSASVLQVTVNKIVTEELRKMVEESEVLERTQ